MRFFQVRTRGVGVVLRFDPEDQAVLSPALNTAFVFPADTGDAIKQMADKKVQDEHFLFLNLHAPVMQSVLDRLELSSSYSS